MHTLSILNKHNLLIAYVLNKFLTKKRICNYTHYTNYTHRGHTFTFKNKTTYLSLYWQKYNSKNFNQKKNTKKEKYEMKGENKNNKCEILEAILNE